MLKRCFTGGIEGHNEEMIMANDFNERAPTGWVETSYAREFTFLQTGSNAREQLTDVGDVGYIHYGDLHKRPSLRLHVSNGSLPSIEASLVANLPSVRNGDLVMVDASEDTKCIGIASEIVGVDEKRVVAGLHTFLLRPSRMAVGFPALIQHNPHVRRQLVQIATGVSVFGITKGNLGKVKFALPPEPEQEAIVRVVDAAEGAVRAADALIEKKVLAKQAIAEELLTGRRRLPGFAEPWKETRLKAFFRPKDQRAPTDTPLILSCSKVYGIVPQSERFSKQMASVDNAHYKHIVPGDLVYDPMLLWDASISFSDYEGIVSPAYETFAWIGDEVGHRLFFRALFKSSVMKQVYKRISQGTNARRRKAPASDFLREPLRLPGRDEQIAIAELLGTLNQEVSLLRSQRDALNEQKKGLMQKLLTGEVRLKEFRS
jgi:type I restriction enzyme, S subunit